MKKVDEDIERAVREHGIDATLAALCRFCNDAGMLVLFRKLNRVYEWLIDARVQDVPRKAKKAG